MNKPELNWEALDTQHERAKVFGGWVLKSTLDVLVSMHEDQCPTNGYEVRESMVFIPDPGHEWGNQEEEVMRDGYQDPFFLGL